MADGPPAGPADGLSPEQEEVRRLLADARHAGPMPDDVVDRLDRVLAGLATDSGDDRVAAPAASVVSLASRRRRRATGALVAAAAVVAVGIGLGQVIGDGVGGGGSADSTAASSAQERESGADGGLAGPDPASGDARVREYVVSGPLPIRPEHFSSDVRRIRRDLRSLVVDQTSKGPRTLSSSPPQDEACAADGSGPGALVPVRYGSERGVLVFGPVRGDSQVVELFACGNPEALRSVTLPAP
jgi:hypothetical protein